MFFAFREKKIDKKINDTSKYNQNRVFRSNVSRKNNFLHLRSVKKKL